MCKKKEAYLTTINDLQIAISNCNMWEFDLINEYTQEIEKYRRLIKELENENE
jgi:hypothetical protein